MKNLSFKTISSKVLPLLHWLRRYRVILFIVALVCVYSALVLRINMLNNQEPSDSDVSTQLQAVHPPKLDPAIIEKIQQLQDNSVDVKSLFNQARENPFQE